MSVKRFGHRLLSLCQALGIGRGGCNNLFEIGKP